MEFDGPSIFGSLDLTSPEDVVKFLTACNEYISESFHSDFVIGLRFILEEGKFSQGTLKYAGRVIGVQSSDKFGRTVPVKEFAQHGLMLKALAKCEGFEQVLQAFSNPTQIIDTLFEVRSAFFMFSRQSIEELKFYPEVEVNSGIKKPEFEVKTRDGSKIYCECKSIHRETHESIKRFRKMANYVIDRLSNIKILDNLRIDVYQTQLNLNVLSSETEKLVNQIKYLIDDGVSGLQEFGSFHFSITERQNIPPFDDYNIELYQQVGGTNPTKIGVENSSIWVGANDTHFSRAVSNVIANAYKQIPKEKWGMIFLQLDHPNRVIQAILNRLESSDYEHILGIVLGLHDQFNVRCRESEKSIVDQLIL